MSLATASGAVVGRTVLHSVDGSGVAQPVNGSNPIPTSSMPAPSTWTARGSADNAVATAARPAEPGKSHQIAAVTASFSGAATALLTVKDGTAVVLEQYVVNREVIPLGGAPLKATAGNAVSAELAAAGLGIIGKVALVGLTA